MPIAVSTPSLFQRGLDRLAKFCEVNEIPSPSVVMVPKHEWHFDCCAYYRPTHIKICLPMCAHPATERAVRNWNWPGSTTDREPFGVIAHELGHHCDVLLSTQKGPDLYFGEYGESVCNLSGEKPITSYAPNSAEWFAEMFRLFVTNHALLERLRPKTHKIISNHWKPVSSDDWVAELGGNVPRRILANLWKKVR